MSDPFAPGTLRDWDFYVRSQVPMVQRGFFRQRQPESDPSWYWDLVGRSGTEIVRIRDWYNHPDHLWLEDWEWLLEYLGKAVEGQWDGWVWFVDRSGMETR